MTCKQDEIDDMRTVFEGRFLFDAQEWHIPSVENPTLALQDAIHAFLSAHRDKNQLLIVYYAGHGVANKDGKSIWQANLKADSPTLRWYAVQPLLENAMPRVLIILDCCFAATAAKDLGGGTTKEVLAACGRSSTTSTTGKRSFTSVLIEELYSFGSWQFTTAMLHARLAINRKKLQKIPIYALLSEEGGDSIQLRPRPPLRAPIIIPPPTEEAKIVITISFARGSNPSVSTPPGNDEVSLNEHRSSNGRRGSPEMHLLK